VGKLGGLSPPRGMEIVTAKRIPWKRGFPIKRTADEILRDEKVKISEKIWIDMELKQTEGPGNDCMHKGKNDLKRGKLGSVLGKALSASKGRLLRK